MLEKKELRKLIIKERDAMPETLKASKSSEVCRKILASERYRISDVVYGFIPYRGEIDILPILEDAARAGKKVAVPRIKGDDMYFYYIESMDDLEEGFKGIMEPCGYTTLAEAENPLIIAPGVGFTRQGARMGYGKGFYDKYLSNHAAYTMGVCFAEQLREDIPTDERDIMLDEVIWA